MTTGRTRTAIVSLALALGALLVPAGPASALVTHQFASSFDGADAPGGPFFLPATAAVDTSGGANDGDVYVGNLDSSFTSAVYRFQAAGTYAGEQLTGTPTGPFSLVNFSTFDVSSVAVDSSAGANSGDLYVADAGNGVVDRFDSSGNYLCQITGGATASTSECNATGSATPDGSFSPTGVTVDASGNLYIADSAHKLIDVFGPSGEYLHQIVDPHIVNPAAIAVDSNGNLYLANANVALSNGINVVEFHNGIFRSVLDSNAPMSVAVDPASDEAYVIETSPRKQVAEFDPAGSRVDTFGTAQLNDSSIVPAVVVGTGHTVYVSTFTPTASPAGLVDVFPVVTVPSATTAPPSNVNETSATLNGHVDPDAAHGGGPVTSCQFEYVDDAAYEPAAPDPYSAGQTVPCSPATQYTVATDVSASIGGLTAQTTYHFRLVVTNSDGTNQTADATFETVGPPVIESESSSDVGAHTARLHARINPFASDTSCEVEYVEDLVFQQSGYDDAATAPCDPAILSGFEPQSIDMTLGGLAVGTTYHFRFVATSQAGPATGEDQTFATFGIKSFSLDAVDQNDQPYAQAGGHPYALVADIEFNTTTTTENGNPQSSPSANVRDLTTDLPAGLVGDPTATSRCDSAEFLFNQCSGAAQVGVIQLHGALWGTGEIPVYNITPPKGVTARFGFLGVTNVPVFFDASVRTGGDYGVSAGSLRVPQLSAVEGLTLTMWGVPADQSHDPLRHCADGNPLGCSSGLPRRPFLTNPTSCLGQRTATTRADSWSGIGDFVTAQTTMPAITGCDRPPFTPSFGAQPTSSSADSPTGLHVNLEVPQNDNPDGFAAAHLKKAVVTLPEGVSVNPSSAGGLAACSPAQIDLSGPGAATCPDASKVGTVEVDTPLLEHPLPGAVYIASPHDNPFGSLLAIYIAVNDPIAGVIVKLAGEVHPDPQTGQLTTTFKENPQLPFEDFELNFVAGPRAALTTPPMCGEYETTTDLTPWTTPEEEDAHPFDRFQIGSGPGSSPCAQQPSDEPNTPSFSAGTITPLAGKYTPFVLNLKREDGSQRLSAIDAQLPPGLIGKLAGIPYCPEAALAVAGSRSGATELSSPSCPAASQVGMVDVGAGSGSQPYRVTGKAYLTGPYKGAPLGLAIVTPAVAGPFDLGNVVVRAALYVNPETAQISAKSDPLPTILQGIPIDVRSIALRMDRPRFTLNPTSCKAMSVTATALSVLGQVAPLSSRFQVGGCGDLGFKPKLTLSLKGGTERGKHPALRAVLKMRAGEANIAKAQVALPHSEFLDNAHIKTICTRVQFAEGARPGERCPPDSIYGHARAITPLLDKPLEGPVYLRSSSHQLPDLVAALNGQIQVVLDGTIDSVKGGIRNRFEVVPDAPVSKFVLSMQGGKKGLLVNSTNLCRSTNRATAKFTAHSGKVNDFDPVVENSCAKQGKRKGRRHR